MIVGANGAVQFLGWEGGAPFTFYLSRNFIHLNLIKVHALAKGMAERGHQMQVFTTFPFPGWADDNNGGT